MMKTSLGLKNPIFRINLRPLWKEWIPSCQCQVPATDRRLGFREVEVGVQKNSNVLVSSFQGDGESGAAVLKKK